MRAESVDERPAGTSYGQELREGWTFLRKDPVLLSMNGMVAVTNLLDLAFSAVLLPVWIKENGYGAGVLGAYFATWALSSAGGSMVAAWAAERLPRFHVYVWSFVITGIPRFLLLALGVPWWLVIASCLVGGFASGFLNPILGAVMYERIPDAVMGRVTTIGGAMCWSLMPFGALLGGFMSDGFGVTLALLVAGGGYLVATMAPLAIPSFRQFDKPAAPRIVEGEQTPDSTSAKKSA
jgi:MFS family permease